MSKIKIGLIGLGTVGSGVVELILKNKKTIEERCGQKTLDVKHILDIRDFSSHQLAELFTKDFNDILNDNDIKIVVETMGGLHPAYEYVVACLKAGKHVVTSNKELVAAKGCELLQIADENNVNFLFEASVGGGIPIIRPMQTDLASNEILSVSGILNGTTNFILTKMKNEGAAFSDVLKLAQEKGYAEANPAADVEGLDAAPEAKDIYNLQGQKLQNVKSNGLYIVDGKKVFINNKK